MPNWSRNSITFSDKDSYSKIKGICMEYKNKHGGERDFDFNAFIPMPPEVFSGNCSDGDMEEMGKKDIVTWYDWGLTRWDVKWNSDGSTWDDENLRVFFSTAWNPPFQVISRISLICDKSIVTLSASAEGGYGGIWNQKYRCGVKVSDIPGGSTSINSYDDEEIYNFMSEEYWSKGYDLTE